MMTRRVLVACAAALALGACAMMSPRGPGEFVVDAFGRDLVLMPVGDERPPTPDRIDVSRDVRSASLRILTKKGYAAFARDELAAGGVAAPRGLGKAPPSELAALGPRDAGMLAYVAVTKVEHGYDHGGEKFDVTLTGVIVDPVTSKVLWRDTGSGRTSLGGFMRIFSPQSPSYDAVYAAVKSLFRNLPSHAKSR